MKKITAMLMALTIAALSLTGCSKEDESSVSEDNSITAPSVENGDFVYTSNYQIEYSETTTEAQKQIMAESEEELLKGFLNAIGSQDEVLYNLYTLGADAPSWGKFHDWWKNRLHEKGIDFNAPMIYSDYIVFNDPHNIYHPDMNDYYISYWIEEDVDTGLYHFKIIETESAYPSTPIDFENLPSYYNRVEFTTEMEVEE